jgi:hypothetical protein
MTSKLPSRVMLAISSRQQVPFQHFDLPVLEEEEHSWKASSPSPDHRSIISMGMSKSSSSDNSLYWWWTYQLTTRQDSEVETIMQGCCPWDYDVHGNGRLVSP